MIPHPEGAIGHGERTADRGEPAERRPEQRAEDRLGQGQEPANATKHGLAGDSIDLESGPSPEFQERRARWAAEQKPVGEAAHWALDRAVAASIRIERCEHAVDNLVATTRQRAALAWDEDREVEAATLASRLARDPALVSRQLQTTLAGVRLLIEGWFGLSETLEAGSDWSESEASEALDRLGVAPDRRAHGTLIDAPEGTESLPFRRALVLEELERLETLRDEALVPLEEMEQRRAMGGHAALLSRPAKLLLRYERDAWKRYRESMKEVQAPVVETPSAPPAAEPTRTPERKTSPVGPSQEKGLRALLSKTAGRPDSINLEEEDARLDALERRIKAMTSSPGIATERTQFVRSRVGAGSTGTQG